MTSHGRTGDEPPVLSVIVPTRDSAKGIRRLLESLLAAASAPSTEASLSPSSFEIVLNDDIRSSDQLDRVVADYEQLGLKITLLHENTSRAQARIVAAARSKGRVLVHLDSDMSVSPGLLQECVEVLATGHLDALVIPEWSVGESYWARVKALEKAYYQGVAPMESARAFRREVYEALRGHNPDMVFSEDKDLDLRLRSEGYRVGTTKAWLIHHEGSIHLSDALRKKFGYAETAGLFASAHPTEYRWLANPLNRYGLFARHWRDARHRPAHYVGVYLLKTAEYACSFVALVWRRIGTRSS